MFRSLRVGSWSHGHRWPGEGLDPTVVKNCMWLQVARPPLSQNKRLLKWIGVLFLRIMRNTEFRNSGVILQLRAVNWDPCSFFFSSSSLSMYSWEQVGCSCPYFPLPCTITMFGAEKKEWGEGKAVFQQGVIFLLWDIYLWLLCMSHLPEHGHLTIPTCMGSWEV